MANIDKKPHLYRINGEVVLPEAVRHRVWWRGSYCAGRSQGCAGQCVLGVG